MKASVKWLKEYVSISVSAGELAEKLTMAGMEVKAVISTGGNWNGVSVAQIVSVASHPNADRLKLVTVDLGNRKQEVVSGALNLRSGDKIAFAVVGAELIDGHTGEKVKLKPAKIRGVVSEGMVCSEKELGISESHEGILVLPAEAPVGATLAEYLGDSIIDLDITPNRPDCMSLLGIAREAAALTGTRTTYPAVSYSESPEAVKLLASVEIIDQELCPRYCASLITGIRVGPSPVWLQERLVSCDMRPINNVVDITNYVMMEYGQPLHSFDFDKLAGRRIVVRRARSGESIMSLDNVKRSLNPDMLVIADAEKPVAIAGVMGGLETEVVDSTTNILLESANFERGALRRTSLSLVLRSEASARFEKGLSPELPLSALLRATRLMVEITGGKAAKGIIDVYPGKKERVAVTLTTTQVKRLLGTDISVDEIKRVLGSLEFECVDDGPGKLQVNVPYWRTDIFGAADLIEEVARISGYDSIPTTMLSAMIPSRRPSPATTMREKVRDTMAGFGYQEVLTYSLVSLDSLKKITPDLWLPGPEPLRLFNPMSRDQEYLRTSLRANVLGALAYNQKYESGNIKLFELGRVFIPRKDDLPLEKQQLCAVFNGGRIELSWGQHGKFVDFYDAKGVVEGLLSGMGAESPIHFHRSDDVGLHPGKRADILLENSVIGVIGEVHPKVAEAFELTGSSFLVEIDVDQLIRMVGDKKKFQPFVRFPSVTRDMAIIVDEGVDYKQVSDLIARYTLVTQVTLFDVYKGKQVPEGKKSFALRLIYQSPKQTLTEEQVNDVHGKILESLQTAIGAVLRS